MSITDDKIKQIHDKWDGRGCLVMVHPRVEIITVDVNAEFSASQLRELADDLDGLEEER